MRKTAAVFLGSFATYWLVKIVPFWWLAFTAVICIYSVSPLAMHKSKSSSNKSSKSTKGKGDDTSPALDSVQQQKSSTSSADNTSRIIASMKAQIQNKPSASALDGFTSDKMTNTVKQSYGEEDRRETNTADTENYLNESRGSSPVHNGDSVDHQPYDLLNSATDPINAHLPALATDSLHQTSGLETVPQSTGEALFGKL